MRSPFLIARLTFFLLLLLLNFLVLTFTAWNINVTTAAGLSVPGSQPLLVFNSCVALILLPLGLTPMVWSHLNTAHLTLETIWVQILSFLQIGAAIASTVNSSEMVVNRDWSIRASALLLVPTTWLVGLLQLAYFLVLFVSAMSHSRVQRDIWTQSIYDITWFGFNNNRLKNSDISIPRPKTGFEDDSWTRHLEDIESTAARKAKHAPPPGEKPTWAPTNTRRGVDPPFIRRETSPRTSASQESITPPVKAEVKGQSVGSRFIERFRDSQTISRPPLHPTPTFAGEVHDHDLPIPKTRFSRWVRADELKPF
ncbi:hypothetical protein Moror_6430 [Moniliophthora roreri MCA 2997]|uniref:Transmembrane protein n=1 Tax=Moniliophthora roreri (strain MCA 2997) TaxID=1381753 RepID=V2XSW2_MONRO|nr:hypothetical protein Moror_6430 [Moniliophthora roreri MCA 2997]KAI3610730.1 hypothetical protein WG66_007104 [Moniliophthora roreri]